MMMSHNQQPAIPPKYADHNSQPAIESINIRASVVTVRTFHADVSLGCSKWGLNAPVASVLAVRAGYDSGLVTDAVLTENQSSHRSSTAGSKCFSQIRRN